jgi:quercetin dioxygenase-like cupin family protein
VPVSAPLPTKIDLLARAREEPPFAPRSVGRIGEVTVNLARGGGLMPLWHTSDEPEYQICLHGSCRFELMIDGVSLEPVEIGPGELLVIPPGVAHRVECSADTVAVNVCRVDEFTVPEAEVAPGDAPAGSV